MHVIPANDPAFNAAAKEARRQLSVFAAKLRSKSPDCIECRVKVEFQADDVLGVEDFWIEPTHVGADGSVDGLVSEPSTRIARLKQGSEIHARADQIVDWMYVQDGKIFGQFTMRAQFDRMTPQQRAQFEALLAPTPLEPGDH